MLLLALFLFPEAPTTSSVKQDCASGNHAYMKVAAINDDVAFMGSCNWTFSSLANQEICLRLQGHAAQQIHEVVFDVVKTAALLKDGE